MEFAGNKWKKKEISHRSSNRDDNGRRKSRRGIVRILSRDIAISRQLLLSVRNSESHRRSRTYRCIVRPWTITCRTYVFSENYARIDRSRSAVVKVIYYESTYVRDHTARTLTYIRANKIAIMLRRARKKLAWICHLKQARAINMHLGWIIISRKNNEACADHVQMTSRGILVSPVCHEELSEEIYNTKRKD